LPLVLPRAAAPKLGRLSAGQAGPKGNLREFLEADKKARSLC
jgi:hypothetical protein